MNKIKEILTRIDGRGYKAYKDLLGRYSFPFFELLVDHVQADPFAAPSRLRARVPHVETGLPGSAFSSGARRRAARDFIARRFREAGHRVRELAIDAGAQTVLDRTAVMFDDEAVELRFTVDLPARGRRILGRQAMAILLDRLPEVVADASTAERLPLDDLERHCAAVEDQVALREQLADRELAAFVPDGAMLPRRSGIDDRPLESGVPFRSPASLRVTLDTPNAGPVEGMGVRRGITLIVGGGFHGKSTLLNALEQGVYDHCPFDGRDGVVTDPTAVKIRAEDGRSVQCMDLSPYINRLPREKSTERFTTELASGSTSQAAALQEGLEAGARTLLVDEDTSATNFMIRDERMQALVAKAYEPITPFVDRIRQLRDELGVSTVLVMGGSGDYFDCADTVIQLREYEALDVTESARAIAREHATGRREESGGALLRPTPRRLQADSIDPTVKKGKRKIQARGCDTLIYGRSRVDLAAVEQLVDASQVRAIGLLMGRMSETGGEIGNPVEWLRQRLRDIDWNALSNRPDGDLAMPRVAEAMAALNRLRTARFRSDT